MAYGEVKEGAFCDEKYTTASNRWGKDIEKVYLKLTI